MPTYPYGQVVEIGKGDWETAPGSATAYQGTDDENSPPDSWGSNQYEITQQDLSMPGAVLEGDGSVLLNGGGELNGMNGNGKTGIDWSQIDTGQKSITQKQAKLIGEQLGDDGPASEPCGLTIGEWQAHQAQMTADLAQAKQQKTMHMVLAGVAGYLLCNFMK